MAYLLFKRTNWHPDNTLLQVEFEAHEEYCSPESQFSDKEDAAKIIQDQHDGNYAAWFSAKVWIRAAGTDINGKAQYLGCCSYKSFEEFMEDQYFRDMIDEATKEFVGNIPTETQKLKSAMNVLETIAKGVK